MRGVILAVLAGGVLSACVGGSDGLRRFENTGGPDEFSVQPARPLEVPDQLTLPVPGGGNRADADPVAEAVAALGGRSNAAGGIPASDSALVGYVSRNGVPADIRATVAAEDAAFRGRIRAGGFFNWFGRDRYFPTYARQALDAYAELERFREAGVAVPTAPPR